jgi:hypothetical protein
MSTEVDFGENPDLEKTVEIVNELKEFIVQYVGKKMLPDDGNVTVGMVVETFVDDFPEFLMAVAEENWIRGYHQGLSDVEEGEKLAALDPEESEDE